ncbi:MAG: hypothetical protein P8X53_01130 [Chromatiales bacterium]|jgi:hypothetical protein
MIFIASTLQMFDPVTGPEQRSARCRDPWIGILQVEAAMNLAKSRNRWLHCSIRRSQIRPRRQLLPVKPQHSVFIGLFS